MRQSQVQSQICPAPEPLLSQQEVLRCSYVLGTVLGARAPPSGPNPVGMSPVQGLVERLWQRRTGLCCHSAGVREMAGLSRATWGCRRGRGWPQGKLCFPGHMGARPGNLSLTSWALPVLGFPPRPPPPPPNGCPVSILFPCQRLFLFSLCLHHAP